MAGLIGFVFRHREVLTGMCILGLLAGCNALGAISSDLPTQSQAGETVIPSLTNTVQSQQPIAFTRTPDPIVTSETPTHSLLLTPTATELPCDLAAAGVPLDVNYPDDTRVNPSERIVKTWRLVNAGSCDWTSEYTIEWFSGDLPSSNVSQPLEGVVLRGKSVDISVEIIAPQAPGIYTSYWILKNPKGDLFGIGPEGRSPFWIRIQVVAEDNFPTPSEATPVPEIIYQASGEMTLTWDGQLDLDSGVAGLEAEADIQLQNSDTSGIGIAPLNNTRLGLIGVDVPSPATCQGLTMTENLITLAGMGAAEHICYLTSAGSWGYFQVNYSTSDPIQEVTVIFYTWMQP